jgi:arsenate reductase
VPTKRCRPAPPPPGTSTPKSSRSCELDIDLSERTPQLLTRELATQADIVVTMGCGDQCPYIPGKRYIDWELPDPAGQPLETVRTIRNLIATHVNALLTQLD